MDPRSLIILRLQREADEIEAIIDNHIFDASMLRIQLIITEAVIANKRKEVK